MMFNHQAEEPPKDYSIEAERERWAEWTQTPGKRIIEREPTEERPGLLSSAGIFLALVDDDCHVSGHTPPSHCRALCPALLSPLPHLSQPGFYHVLIPRCFRQELIPGSHTRWRTDFEHDVLLPKDAKDEGTPYTTSWDGESILPETTALRLKAGECADPPDEPVLDASLMFARWQASSDRASRCTAATAAPPSASPSPAAGAARPPPRRTWAMGSRKSRSSTCVTPGSSTRLCGKRCRPSG